MSKDLRDSIGIWASVIVFVAIFLALRAFDVFAGLSERVPPKWFGLVAGVLAIWGLGRFGWGLWQRRASRVGGPPA